MRWFLFIVFPVCINAFSEPLEYPISKHEIGPHVELRVNGITDLKLPVEILSDSKLIILDGLIIQIKDRGDVTIETITAEKIGYPNTDMRLWPSYVMGYQKVVGNSEYSKELNAAMKVFKLNYKPYRTGVFKTENGKGFVAMGKENSVIYLVGNDVSQFITSINIKHMTEDDINNLIIQGLL